MDAQPRPAPECHSDLSKNWVGAGHLKIGDKIKQADGTTGVVANVTTVQQTREMFNLTVSEAHTYYVGQDGWLVHNAGCSYIDSMLDKYGAKWRGIFPDNLSAGQRPGTVLYRTDTNGNVTYYATYDNQGRIVSRVDIDPASATHNGTPPPHIVFYNYATRNNPTTGEEFINRVTIYGKDALDAKTMPQYIPTRPR